ncbi:type III-A CRISPR-associated RAMP protein Csm4 [Neisseria leonii]|uniref:type III-A CRISPR-associated RAMP protein Csm4 n=1 Tax=Neisseria leonii TaxID=2995413 RepID=UPI00237BAB69|nr:hypothetical protein [Neisseria sp. 3986]MDD9325379.1 hypothetical protein [Neisseria sp. 3986]
MQAYKLTLCPETAFGTPLAGDTLFGHICWGIAEQYGTGVLADCLHGYTDNRPFLVVSDAFPDGYLPLPTLPSAYWLTGAETDRKKLKKKQWLPENALGTDSRLWQQQAQSGAEISPHLAGSHRRPHNSLNRQTCTTGTGGRFAPYESEQIWYADGSTWAVYCLLDEGRLKKASLQRVLENIGQTGYGRDASSGLGKFSVRQFAESGLFRAQGNAVLTLAACCPQNLGYAARHSYYHTQTRFGRHGNVQARSGRPFKQPVLMAQTGAVLSGTVSGRPYVGQGISGISHSQPEAVHQGYAPALFFDLDTEVLN